MATVLFYKLTSKSEIVGLYWMSYKSIILILIWRFKGLQFHMEKYSVSNLGLMDFDQIGSNYSKNCWDILKF